MYLMTHHDSENRDILHDLQIREPFPTSATAIPPTSRQVYAAAHVVANPLLASKAATGGTIDWDTTLQIRHNIWNRGLGVAESMDTAQRGMGLSASDAMALAARSLNEDPRGGKGVVVGINTDALESETPTLEEISDAYLRQLEVVEAGGGTAVMMASRHLARVAHTAQDYLTVYERVISASDRIVLHWLGEVFDPELRGYWGTTDLSEALETVANLISSQSQAIAGIKISLLDPTYELNLRRRLPSDVALFTGDDFNYVDMIAGDGQAYSHALLGAFAYLAPIAAEAFTHLDAGDERGFRNILGPTQKLSRLVFENPTPHYKVGVAWLSYLSGAQSHFRMLDGFESNRNLTHLAAILKEAGTLGLFPDPEFTRQRAHTFFAAQGLV